MTRATKIGLAGILITIGSGIVGVAMLVEYGFSARDEPTGVEAFVARRMRLLAIPHRARQTKNPIISVDTKLLAETRAHFADHCAICHGNDGSGDTPIGRNLYPKPPDMRKSETQSLSDGELFYIIHNGIRLTGMPAWGGDDPAQDEDSWKLVHFIRHLPEISATEVAEMKRLNPKSPHEMQEEKEVDEFLRGEGGSAPPSHH